MCVCIHRSSYPALSLLPLPKVDDHVTMELISPHVIVFLEEHATSYPL